MAADFDPEDKNSWFFGPLSRDDANRVLLSECETGEFLVRDSSTIRGDFVLCVKEDNKVSHYIINKIQVGGKIRFRIGEQEFPDLPSLLNFYKTHYLDTTSLIKPAPREIYVAKYDFPGRDPEDLPFKRGDVLTILQKDEDEWWMARNRNGDTGLVPKPYIEKYDAEVERQTRESYAPRPVSVPSAMEPESTDCLHNGPPNQRHLPARAIVTRPRVPCAYDTSALRLVVGDQILVTAMNINGQWEGELNDKRGHFPFTHVKFIDENDPGHDDDLSM